MFFYKKVIFLASLCVYVGGGGGAWDKVPHKVTLSASLCMRVGGFFYNGQKMK